MIARRHRVERSAGTGECEIQNYGIVHNPLNAGEAATLERDGDLFAANVDEADYGQGMVTAP